MDGQNAIKKRGRPPKYASAEEKARAGVERRRELRRKEAHERRERLHAEFYGVAYTPPKEEDKPLSLQIVLKTPGGLKTERLDADYLEGAPKRDGVELKNRKGFEAIKRPIRAYKCQDYVHIQAHHPHLESKKERDGHGNLVGCQDHCFPPLLETKLGMPVILLTNINPTPHRLFVCLFDSIRLFTVTV
jgi:hypothetical protein